MDYKETLEYAKSYITVKGIPIKAKEATECIINALEKQIPKKPITHAYELGDESGNDVVCPVCGSLLGSVGDIEQGEIMKIPFCWNCGQALKWSEVEE